MTTSEQLEKLSESIKECADQCVEVHVEKKENIPDFFFVHNTYTILQKLYKLLH